MLNIEIKARCNDLVVAEKAVLAAGAVFKTVLQQKDTYFNTENGRLKLREIAGGTNQLIFYKRANMAGPRNSEYSIYTTEAVDTLKTMLEDALSISVVVEKQRKLILYDEVRVHLDQVKGLGSFLELEGVVDAQADYNSVRSKVDYLMDVLAITENDLISLSYSDLLTQN
jgi:predicted adenylyl cyclase CyaB